MSALVLDAGALIAIDRGERPMIARLRAAQRHGVAVRTSAIVVAEVWRDESGRQAELARVLRAVEVIPLEERLARAVGVLLGRTGTSDPVDASVVLVAESGDRILTSDPGNIGRLAAAARAVVAVVAC